MRRDGLRRPRHQWAIGPGTDLDRAAPEPIRSALLEGANWWNQAFQAAGYRNAFQVELMPPDMDPMDARYNVIQWIHRYTRGWSYGETIIDPRTGEILKGQVTLGSLRGRQDYLIMEGLLAPYVEGQPVSSEMERVVLDFGASPSTQIFSAAISEPEDIASRTMRHIWRIRSMGFSSA